MLKKISTLLLIALFSTPDNTHASSSTLLDDFLIEEVSKMDLVREPKPAFASISFPGDTRELFDALADNISKLQSTHTSFPYSEEEMNERWTALLNNFKKDQPVTEEDMLSKLSYFSLMHFPQLCIDAPETAGKLKRVERNYKFAVLPSKKEVLWMFPQKLLNGVPREIFEQFVEILFQHFDSAKSQLDISTAKTEKDFHERIQNQDVSPSALKSAGWPRHTPQTIVIGWFCLYDRLKDTYDAFERKKNSLLASTSTKQGHLTREPLEDQLDSFLILAAPAADSIQPPHNTSLPSETKEEQDLPPIIEDGLSSTPAPKTPLELLQNELEANLLYELSLTINLHAFVKKQMSSHFQEILPSFKCEACRGSALALHGIGEQRQ